jgi:hypothetical protein
MKSRSISSVLLAVVFIAGLVGARDLMAQAPGNNNNGAGRNRGARNPAQFQERRMERYREQLEVKSDDEWTIIQQRIEKVLEAQREARSGGFGGGRRGPAPGGANADAANAGGRSNNRPGRAATDQNPEAEALQAALDANAPPAEIKAKLAKLGEVRKVKEANLTKAQQELRDVLSVRQEAIATLIGLLR